MYNLLSNPIISVALVIILIIVLIVRQIRPRKLSAKGFIVMPIILFYFIVEALPSFHPSSTQLLEMTLSSAVSLILGLLACRQLHVYEGKSGRAMAKGSWQYFLWWLGAFIAKSFIAVALGETSGQNLNTVAILLPVFFLLVTRNAYLYFKTKRLELVLH